MSIYFSGCFTRSGGIVSAIAKQLKTINLKPVKKITVQFDPFHANAVSVRDFVFYLSSPKISNTNLSCVVKTNVVCDRSEPFVKIDLLDSKCIKLLSNNLTTLELLQLYNKNVSSLVKEEELTNTKTTKATQKPTQGKKRLK